MATEGTNGSTKRRRQGVCAPGRVPADYSRVAKAKLFYHDRLARSLTNADTLQKAFEEGNLDTVRKFSAMYARDSVVQALEELGLNIRWELCHLQKVVQHRDSSPQTIIEAISHIQAIRATVFDNRQPATAKPARVVVKAPAEVSSFMQQEAASADAAWGPTKVRS